MIYQIHKRQDISSVQTGSGMNPASSFISPHPHPGSQVPEKSRSWPSLPPK